MDWTAGEASQKEEAAFKEAEGLACNSVGSPAKNSDDGSAVMSSNKRGQLENPTINRCGEEKT